MASAVRRLMQLTVTSTPEPGTFGAVAARIEALCDELAAEVPDDGPEPVGRFAQESIGPRELSNLTAAMPFDMVVGSCNPVAPPIELWFDKYHRLVRQEFTESGHRTIVKLENIKR